MNTAGIEVVRATLAMKDAKIAELSDRLAEALGALELFAEYAKHLDQKSDQEAITTQWEGLTSGRTFA